MKIPERFGFYAIMSDPLKGYDYMARLFVDYQIAFIQLRMKNTPIDAIRKQAEIVFKITEGSNSHFIINDFPEIAATVGADGVHIGQEDMAYDKARSIVGANAVVGISTHSPDQTRLACGLNPDYIGIGPVFPTPTKAKPDKVIGVDGMKAMLSLATVPAVAIGGIDLSNLHAILDAGANNFCMVRQLMSVDDPERTLKQVLKIYKEY